MPMTRTAADFTSIPESVVPASTDSPEGVGMTRRYPGMSEGLIIDLFAGGGGASTGIEAALGRSVDVAINHDAIALAVHKANHPGTRHLEEDIWKARPEEVTGGRPVAVLWASPDCTHHSKAKGGKPRSKKLRTLAWAVVRWAAAVKPAVIFLENVTEFADWGPLTAEGKPDKRFMGRTFNAWRRKLVRLGYVVDWRTLDASLYGAPTRRRRLFMVARRDGLPIVWPVVTHGDAKKAADLFGHRLHPLRTAAECIDFSQPCPSIFTRKKPLAEKTLWRIAQGIQRYVLNNPQPFVVGVGGRAGQTIATAVHAPLGTITAKNDRALVAPVMVTIDNQSSRNGCTSPAAPLPTTTTENRHAVLAPCLVQSGYGEREGQAARTLDLLKPMGTLVGGQKQALVASFLAKHFGGVVGQAMSAPLPTVTTVDHSAVVEAACIAKFRGTNGQKASQPVTEPLPTISAGGLHVADVRAFLTTYYKSERAGQSIHVPLRTITTKDRLGLVTIQGTEYQIVDIGMRMLQPAELLRGQFGRFAAGYDLSAARTKSAQVRLIGNSVCPEVAEAMVRANLPQARASVAA